METEAMTVSGVNGRNGQGKRYLSSVITMSASIPPWSTLAGRLPRTVPLWAGSVFGRFSARFRAISVRLALCFGL